MFWIELFAKLKAIEAAINLFCFGLLVGVFVLYVLYQVISPYYRRFSNWRALRKAYNKGKHASDEDENPYASHVRDYSGYNCFSRLIQNPEHEAWEKGKMDARKKHAS